MYDIAHDKLEELRKLRIKYSSNVTKELRQQIIDTKNEIKKMVDEL